MKQDGRLLGGQVFDPDHLTKNLGIVNSLTVNSFVCVSMSHHFFCSIR